MKIERNSSDYARGESGGAARQGVIVGVDEAGYGPTLGPLVVSAAVFRVPRRAAAATSDRRGAEGGTSDDRVDVGPNLWKLLKETVTRKPDGDRIPVNDSKKIHRPRKGLGRLEDGIFPFLTVCRQPPPVSLRELLRYLCRSQKADRYFEAYPWYRDCDVELPTESFQNYVNVLGTRLADDLRRNDVDFLGFASSPVDVIRFNRGLVESNNKSLIPFRAIGELLVRIWRRFSDDEVDVVVDRQGGRINYAKLLFEFIKPRGIRVETQSEESSIYVLVGKSGGSMRVTFTRQGDSKSFAVALASMVSKYVRELHMALFNQFWTAQIDTLKPTAGYPTDARRFLRDIAEAKTRLGIGDELLIRRR